MPDASDRPTRRCLRCKWNAAAPEEPICWTCAISITRRHCPHDGTPELLIQRTSNGYQHPKLRCRTCYKPVGNAKLRDVDPALVEAEVQEGRQLPPCARCGRLEVEIHHWAPRHLFLDADQWPTSALCPNCHRLWHVTTGTAGTSQPRTDKSRPASTDESPTVPEVDPWTPVESLFGESF